MLAEEDRRILELLTQGEYERARLILEDRVETRLADLSSSPPPLPSPPPPPPPPPST